MVLLSTFLQDGVQLELQMLIWSAGKHIGLKIHISLGACQDLVEILLNYQAVSNMTVD